MGSFSTVLPSSSGTGNSAETQPVTRYFSPLVAVSFQVGSIAPIH